MAAPTPAGPSPAAPASIPLGPVPSGSVPLAAADGVEVVVAQMGTLGPCSVGVVAVMDGPRAQVVVAGQGAGIAWESTQDVAPGQSVLAAGVPFRVGAITPTAGGVPGRVHFAPASPGSGPGEAKSYPDSAVVLAAGGALRLDGPEIETATDIRVSQWQPGEQAPTAVRVEWWPAQFVREYTDAADIHAVSLSPGGHAALGSVRVSVLAIEAASSGHPARVVLQLLGHAGK